MRQATFLLSCLFFVSCKYERLVCIAENCIYDSITIDSIVDESELLNMSVLDSQTIISFNRNDNNINYYKKRSNYYFYQKAINLNLNNFFLESSFVDNKYLFLVDRDNDECYVYDLVLNKLSLLPPQSILPILGRNYTIAASKDLPVYFVNGNTDSMIASMYWKSLQYYYEYYNEKFVQDFLITGDSIQFNQGYFNTKTAKRSIQIASYKLVNNKLYALFPCVDSLYSYDRNKKEYSVTPIDNDEYKEPEQEWEVTDYQNQKKTTEYRLNNFQYTLLAQDYLYPDNLLFFYKTPVEKKAGANPTFEDQKLKLLVWKANGEKVYYTFKNRYYGVGCALTYKNQLYGLSKLNKLKKNGKMVFYLFDFNNCAAKL